MPMQAGSLMVVVRAQDFASRTLRRVGAEMNGLSRAQRIQAMREQTMYQKSSALSNVAIAESNARRLAYIKEGMARRQSLIEQTAAMERFRAAQKKVMVRGRFASGIDRASIQEFQNASAAIRQYGLEGVLAAKRLAAARAAISQAPTRMKKADRALLTRELVNAERAFNSLSATQRDGIRNWEKLNKQVANFDQRISTLPTSLQRAARNQAAFGDALFRSNRQLERAYMGLNEAKRAELAFNSALRQMPIQRIHDFAHALGGIGRTFQLFGAVGTIAFGLASKAAADFSKATSLAATQVTRIGAGIDEATANSARLRAEILDLAKVYPYSAKEMADATYEIFSSTNVQSIEEGMALLEAFARVGVAGQVDLETATKASITVLNTFRGSTEDVSDTLNRMFAIVRFGRMRFSDFALMLPKVAAAAYASGQSLDDVAGIMAFLTRKTGDAQIAATQISRAFDVFTRKEFRVGIKALGVDIENATGHMLPLPQVLNKIWNEWGRELATGGRGAERFIQIVTRASQIAGKGLLTTTEARRFFRFLFSDFKLYKQLQKKAVADNTEFQRSFGTMLADPGVQWDIFVARIKAGVIEIGQAAIPVFAEIGKSISNFLDWWENLNDSTKGTAIRWGVIASVLTLVSGIFLSLAGVFISVALGMGRIAGGIFRLAANLMGLSAIIGSGGRAGLIGRLFVMWRMLTLLAAIGTISIGIELEKKGDGWSLVGKLLETGGIAHLLKRAGMAGAKRFPVAAVLAELIWPSDTKKLIPAQEFQRLLLDMDKTLAGTMKRQKLLQTQKTAQLIFSKALRTGNFNTAKAATLKYLSSVGVGLEDLGEKSEAARDSWEDFVKRLGKVSNMAGGKKILKALGLDEQSLEQFDQMMDEAANAVADWTKQLTNVQKQAADDAVTTLRNMYMQMEQENRGFFGELFKGPWLTSETFDLAREWGITPGINDMIIDLKQQNAQFARWRSSLDKVMKKGLPKGFMDELRKMGPEEGQSLLDEILSAKPGQVNKLIAEWKQREGQIKQATKMDFSREITAFKNAGGNMGRAMIRGFEEAKVGEWFDKWVKITFPDVINAAVATAVAEWKAQNPKPPSIKPDQKPQTPTNKNTTNNNNNSKSVTVNVRLQDTHDRHTTPEEQVRRVAFIAQNVVRGWL